MKVYDAILQRRSIRKFTQEPIPQELLEKLVDAARMAAYPANMQPLKFAILKGTELCNRVFPCTKWAGYLPDAAPKAGEEPTAYLAILGDKEIKNGTDFQVENGAAGMTILLAALEMGLGACWLGALDRTKLTEIMALPENLVVLDLVALGYPAQESCAEDRQGEDIKYYMDASGKMHVPKRSLCEVLYSIPEQ